MKKIYLLAFAICLLASCAPIANRSFNGQKVNHRTVKKMERGELALKDNEVNTLNPLESYLLRMPGVQIIGGKVKVRGANSFFSETEPLFILNGADVGSSYAKAASMVAGMDVKSVRVLKGPDASFYGVRGGNGVIIIKAS